MRDRMLLLVCTSLAIAVWPISTSSQEITPLEFGVLIVAFALILAIQCAALWLIGRFVAKYADAAANVLVVTFAALNAYYFAFITLEAHWRTRNLLAVLFGIVVAILLRARPSQSRVALFTTAFVCLALGQYGYGRVMPAAAHVATDQGAITLKSKRNVYLISSESLHSPYALRHLYGIADTPHVVYLKQEGFRVLDRNYSADTHTRTTYQRILEYSRFLGSPEEMRDVFRLGNATFASFGRAGYGIQFIYVSSYLDVNHNIIDHGFPGEGFYICDHLKRAFYYFVCRAPVRAVISRALFNSEGQVEVEDEIAHLQERIRVAATDEKPWLTISHVNYPGHTDLAHRYDSPSDVARFKEGMSEWLQPAADHYRQIVSTIKRLDPDAVIVTFGDHGMWLTRGMDSAESNDVFSTEDFIEDRYGVMIAVYPADFCRNRIFEGSTTTLIIRSVIQCLNGDDDPTDAERLLSRTVVYKGQRATPEGIVAQAASAK